MFVVLHCLECCKFHNLMAVFCCHDIMETYLGEAAPYF